MKIPNTNNHCLMFNELLEQIKSLSETLTTSDLNKIKTFCLSKRLLFSKTAKQIVIQVDTDNEFLILQKDSNKKFSQIYAPKVPKGMLSHLKHDELINTAFYELLTTYSEDQISEYSKPSDKQKIPLKEYHYVQIQQFCNFLTKLNSLLK